LQAIPEEVLSRARMLWINYPHNPTAAIAPVKFFQEVVAFAHQHHLLLCADAAYSQVTYDGYRATSLLSIPEAKTVAVEFNSLSKSHNMAGWRIGAAIGNPEALNALLRVKSDADTGQFLPVMEAAVTAMSGDQDWLVERNRIYQERRDVVVKALNEVGLNCALPQASLYVWFHVPAGWTSDDFAALMLEKASISLAPGTVFGDFGEGYIRLSITQPLVQIELAMHRLRQIVGGL
jgi:LL-diaminopimelate aminotransferase